MLRRRPTRIMKRVGIYAGAFDPVHAGHISFALQALEAGKLDIVYFMPERRPRHKQGVEHFGHRVAMLKQAVRPHTRFKVLETVDVSFSVERTLPRLQQRFPGVQLVMLIGSDAARTITSWPNYEAMLENIELIVGVRANDDITTVRRDLEHMQLVPRRLKLIESYAADVSSGKVREALRRRQSVRGVLSSVVHYANRHWLYVSLS